MAVWRRLVAVWGQRLADQRVDVALTAVHRFQQPDRDIFWQRHGLATASAALGGGLAVDAAFLGPSAFPVQLAISTTTGVRLSTGEL